MLTFLTLKQGLVIGGTGFASSHWRAATVGSGLVRAFGSGGLGG